MMSNIIHLMQPYQFIAGLGMAWVAFMVLMTCDVRDKRIPNVIVYPAMIFFSWLFSSWVWCLAGFAIGFAAYILKAFGQRIGEGDVKLAAFMGATLQVYGIAAFALAILFVPLYRFISDIKKPMAFAPFAMTCAILVTIGDKVARAMLP